VSDVCCQAEVSATGRSLVQSSPTDCGVSECDREASIIRRPWPEQGAVTAQEKKFIAGPIPIAYQNVSEHFSIEKYIFLTQVNPKSFSFYPIWAFRHYSCVWDCDVLSPSKDVYSPPTLPPNTVNTANFHTSPPQNVGGDAYKNMNVLLSVMSIFGKYTHSLKFCC
jgi:hypothetical protein